MQSLTALVIIIIIIIIIVSCALCVLDSGMNETYICYKNLDSQKTNIKFYTIFVIIHCEFNKSLHDEISLPSCCDSVIIFSGSFDNEL